VTKYQLEQAQVAYRKALPPEDPCAYLMESIRDGLAAAAPFLQLPWDDPTHDEIVDGTKRILMGMPCKEVLQRFVRNRNAALLPKPVDPRRERVATLLRKLHMDQRGWSPGEIADRILEAIDKDQNTKEEEKFK
jgi:hypothetical protein